MEYRPLNITPLSTEEVRTLVRPTGNHFLPDRVAQGLAERGFFIDTPVILETAEDIAGLVASLREWIEEEGIEVSSIGTDLESSLTPRELGRLRSMAILLAYRALGQNFAEGDGTAALGSIEEGLQYAGAIDDPRPALFLYGILGYLYSRMRRIAEAEEAYATGLRAAERDGTDPLMELAIAGGYTAFLVTYHRLDQAEELIDRMIDRGRETLSPYDQGAALLPLLLNKGRLYALRDEKGKAITIMQEGVDLARPDHFGHHLVPILLTHLGLTYRSLGDFEESIRYCTEAIERAELNDQVENIAWGHVHLSDSYVRLRDFEAAERTLRIAETYASKERGGQFSDYLDRSWAYLCRSITQYDRALEHCNRIIERTASIPTPMKVSAYQVMAEISAEIGNLENAEKHYRSALEVAREMGEGERPIPMELGLTSILIRRERYREGLELLEPLLEDLRQREGADEPLGYGLTLRAEIAEATGQYREALLFAREGCNHRRIALTEQSALSLQNVRVLAEVNALKREAEIERLQRKEAERTLAESLATFEEGRHTLASVETRLRETIRLLDRSRALEVVATLREALDNIDASSSGRTDTSLHYLQTLDRAFFERLRERHPDLTRKQEHFCGLIRSGLSSREIASALGITNEGVRSQRKRLRKRLDISPQENLESVILAI